MNSVLLSIDTLPTLGLDTTDSVQESSVLSSSLTVIGIVTEEPSSTVAEASETVGARSS